MTPTVPVAQLTAPPILSAFRLYSETTLDTHVPAVVPGTTPKRPAIFVSPHSACSVAASGELLWSQAPAPTAIMRLEAEETGSSSHVAKVIPPGVVR